MTFFSFIVHRSAYIVLRTKVVEQLRDRSLKHVRAAVILLAAGSRAFACLIVTEVADDDQIEPAVAVVVEEASRRGPEGIVDPCLLGDVAELATAEVEEKPDVAVFGKEHVGQPVVVDVADGYAHAVTGHVEP